MSDHNIEYWMVLYREKTLLAEIIISLGTNLQQKYSYLKINKII